MFLVSPLTFYLVQGLCYTTPKRLFHTLAFPIKMGILINGKAL